MSQAEEVTGPVRRLMIAAANAAASLINTLHRFH
jgi:hypothetical protein